MDKFSSTIEYIAAILFAVITILLFTSAALRYTLNYPIPDAFDFSRLLLGVAILWGLASASYRDEHIRMDMVWSLLGERGKYWLNVVSGFFVLLFLILISWQMLFQVKAIYQSGDVTFETLTPMWPFYFSAWLGIASAVALGMIKYIQIIKNSKDNNNG
ncbi:MAG: TRAP transporter small permease [Saccharospirillum sp.]|nr:TRAP transporter small permease [Saccharospirillum sp.]